MWSLYQGEKFLKPLVFSNGKSQEDVVKEVLNAIEEGNKIVFIHGVCGTGKSAIALNIANALGKSSVVVPIKNLQEQYKSDYGGESGKYLLKKDGAKLGISVITGRQNHFCKFLQDNKNAIPKREVNSKLNDIFEGRREKIEEDIGKDISADNANIPCKIELKEKNISKIREYLRQNKNVKVTDFDSIKDVKRISVAAVCPYWSPVSPTMYELKGPSFDSAKKSEFEGLEAMEYTFYQRKKGCSFYEQFNSYVEADVIVFNSMKYLLESYLRRKPRTEVEIIDECDEFLDSFSNQRNVNIDRLLNAVNSVFDFKEGTEDLLDEFRSIIMQMKRDSKIEGYIVKDEIVELQKTGLFDIFRLILKNNDFLNEVDEESYLFDVEETARIFSEFMKESYVTFSKKDDQLIASVVTTNLAKRLKWLQKMNNVLVMMSGTLHSENVLRDIYGLENYRVVEAEVVNQGNIEVVKTGLEKDCKYSNFYNGNCTREDYLKALSKCVEKAKRPTLVHVQSYSDLPSEKEIKEFQIGNLISREKLQNFQQDDKNGEWVQKFKQGDTELFFSTRCSRGVDFPGEQCNSIIFTKYPNPNVKDAFWKILAQTRPEHYWEFYRDKAKRELLQKVYRGLRFKEDHVYLLSPDSRVLEAFEN